VMKNANVIMYAIFASQFPLDMFSHRQHPFHKSYTHHKQDYRKYHNKNRAALCGKTTTPLLLSYKSAVSSLFLPFHQNNRFAV
jgi:hypothetical protein